MQTIISDLLRTLAQSEARDAEVISWAAPIPAFGDAARATVATLGLNPSNREFVDSRGSELVGKARRFPTLASIAKPSWDNITDADLNAIAASCRDYFFVNPYHAWFRQLDQLLAHTNTSYYSELFPAAHLDIIPFATSKKWSKLDQNQKTFLLDSSGNALAEIVKNSPLKVIILNGASVIEHFSKVSDAEMEKLHIPEWDLARIGNKVVKGYAYKGQVRRIFGVDTLSDKLVLGFNHNIQSSFGISSALRHSIRDWLGKETKEVLS